MEQEGARNDKEVRGVDYKEILEEQLQLLREIAQQRKYTLTGACEISKSMVEIVNCLNSL